MLSLPAFLYNAKPGEEGGPFHAARGRDAERSMLHFAAGLKARGSKIAVTSGSSPKNWELMNV